MRLGPATLACFSVLALAGAARGSDLEVAVDPGSRSSSALAQGSSRTPEPAPKPRPITAAGSIYALAGTANDELSTDFGHDVALMGRLAFEVYASFAVRDVRLFLGGTTLAIEAFYYPDRTGSQYPALITFGVRAPHWVVAAAGGVTLFATDNTGAFEVPPEDMLPPGPRAELRAGYRARDVFEVSGIVGFERRIALDGYAENRFFLGVSGGAGGDF